jgi:hypothetical protein
MASHELPEGHGLKILAKNLCGEHIGMTQREFVTNYKVKLTDADGKFLGFEKTYKPVPITMITHKKNGNVRVRTTNSDWEYSPDASLELS